MTEEERPDPPDLSAADRDRLRHAVPAPQPIGYVRSDYDVPAQTPIQSLRNDTAEGRIEIFPEFAEGLEGLGGFEFAWVISWLDRPRPATSGWRVVPFMLAHTGDQLGTFATRHPSRPNPIGLSVVRILAVDQASVAFRGVDLCHGTPVLDIKPWEQHLDIPEYGQGWAAVQAIKGGWYESNSVIERGQILPGG